MKAFKNSFIDYSVNLLIMVFLSFSFVFANTATLNMTYGIKDVFIFVGISSILCTIVFWNKISLIITVISSILVVIGGFIYFLNKPIAFEETYSKIEPMFLWAINYINGVVPLNLEYEKYLLVVLSITISIVVYLFSVKRFNFYVLLIGGLTLFSVQWIFDSFVSYLSFYTFVFLILICYFKHIYIKNTNVSERNSYTAPVAFLLFSIPICGLVFLLAYLMPSSDAPLDWSWMDSTIESAQNYVQTRLRMSEDTTLSFGFGDESSLLEGNISLDDTLVMTVDSPVGSLYLKGAVREIYTGVSWESQQSEVTTLGQNVQLDGFNDDLFEFSQGSKIITNNMDILNEFYNKISIDITYENLLTQSIIIPSMTESIIFDSDPINLNKNSYGILSSDDFLNQQFKYTVELYIINNNNRVVQLLRNSSRGAYKGYLQNSSPRGNRQLRRDIERLEEVSKDVYNRYLQLPDKLPERIRDLAIELTSSTTNDYDRVRSIETYLSNNYRYTLEPGNIPKDRDFVDYFLFDLKEGYCIYYASAMTVLVRSLGIPARYVEGYLLPAHPVQGTTYKITNGQAHAWVEVYFEGFGWIPFEPTSSYSEDLYEAVEEILGEESGIFQEENIEEEIVDNGLMNNEVFSEAIDTLSNTYFERDSTKKNSKFILKIIVVFILWILIVPNLRRYLRLYKIQKLMPKQSVIEVYSYLLKILSLQGFEIKPGETPLQFSARIDESFKIEAISYKEITEIFIKARYSNMPIDGKEKQVVKNFYFTFPGYCKKRLGLMKYFVYKIFTGLI
ncbi:uncharacterized protein DUF3488 [Natranaerovirga pectinivora]|uniref:Uncharacterized protein DUF3488 n=1 Tax=Natranaerovirga pectinivora TaxID=682400 RepID=A0A4R3MMA2_9FIRM|nr:transglutaminaseTgpA domain-containing protein [Natranaerovirga pectinivora]TCT16063.1 uncharacterized protein DUF3488 [Natranaerovirga pectinivora]